MIAVLLTTAMALSVGLCAPAARFEALPPVRLQSAANVDLLREGGFEDAGGKAWEFSDWPPRPGTGKALVAKSIYRSNEVVHTGRWALCFDLTTVGLDRTLLAQQRFSKGQLAPHDGKRMRASAWIWVARGPRYYQGRLTMRQWAKPGTPPFQPFSRLDLGGKQGEWSYYSKEFTFRLGDTERGDLTVALRSPPDLEGAPVVFVDDVKLEVLAEPMLAAELLTGRVVFAPDQRLPVRVAIAPPTWAAGKTRLRWDVTTRDGRTGYASGEVVPATPDCLIEAQLPQLPAGEYALRVAVGETSTGRAREVLLPFRYEEGPFAH